jgi:membrane protein YqaA with SNARE-associated domain
VRSLKPFTAKFSNALLHYRGWGLFGLSFLDSAGISLPGLKDFLLIYLSGKFPALAWFYVLDCTIGTAAGSILIYALGRSGARIFRRKPSEKEMSRAMRWIQKNDFVTVVVASLLPPPLPFKPFLIAAGVLRMNALSMVMALMLGGAIRFGAEAWIGVRFGKAGPAYLKSHLILISLVAVAAIVFLTAAYRKLLAAGGKPDPLARDGSGRHDGPPAE